MFTSTDGGRTWTEATVAPATGLGGQPLAQPDGTVVVPYSGNFNSVALARVRRRRRDLHRPVHGRGTTDHSGAVHAGTCRCRRPRSTRTARVYVVWQDCRFRTRLLDERHRHEHVERTASDLVRGPVRIPIDGLRSTVDHFTPGIGVDPTTGGESAHLALTYYYFPTDACTLDTCELFAGFVSSTDGGASWSAPKTGASAR